MTCPASKAANIGVHPMSGYIGAEITGVDLRRPLDAHAIVAIRDALGTWKVVFFRGQQIDHAQHVAFGRQFGDLTCGHPYDTEPPDEFPEIYTVDPERVAARYGLTDEQAMELDELEQYRQRYSEGWHTDVTPAVNPPAGSILRAETVPKYGGDTTFTNLVAAYEGLSRPLRSLADGLRAEHIYGADANQLNLADAFMERYRKNPLVAHHPVVRVHPITGERALFVSPVFTSRILELNPIESKQVLNLLFAQITRPEYTVRFRWEEGSVAFWDNRATAHLGPRDVFHRRDKRVLHRVTLLGDVPVGPDGRQSTLVKGIPFKSQSRSNLRIDR